MLLEENSLNAMCAFFGVKEDIYFYKGGRWLQEDLSKGCSLS